MAKLLKEDAKKFLEDVPGDCVFRCQDGSVFRNMRELRDGLSIMSEETYLFHANADKNDFSAWVIDIITDQKLALDLQKATSADDATRRVGTRFAGLRRK
ncbi:MAG: hypothetical protein WB588_04510 [Dehalococcoidia bacterium]